MTSRKPDKAVVALPRSKITGQLFKSSPLHSFSLVSHLNFKKCTHFALLGVDYQVFPLDKIIQTTLFRSTASRPSSSQDRLRFLSPNLVQIMKSWSKQSRVLAITGTGHFGPTHSPVSAMGPHTNKIWDKQKIGTPLCPAPWEGPFLVFFFSCM